MPSNAPFDAFLDFLLHPHPQRQEYQLRNRLLVCALDQLSPANKIERILLPPSRLPHHRSKDEPNVNEAHLPKPHPREAFSHFQEECQPEFHLPDSQLQMAPECQNSHPNLALLKRERMQDCNVPKSRPRRASLLESHR